MLTNDQKSLLKRAQRQAALPDQEYREALQLVAGVRSSTDPNFTHRHLDKLMAYFEAIYWRKVDAGTCPDPDALVKAGSKRQWLTFLAPGYWQRKNTPQETSRERYVAMGFAAEVNALENELYGLGCNTAYVAAIRLKVTGGLGSARDLKNYKAALARTVESRRKKLETVPF